MKLDIFDDADAVAAQAAAILAAEARAAVAARGRFLLAVSGGKTPWIMLRQLASQDIPWASVQLFQVDERVAPAGDPDEIHAHARGLARHTRWARSDSCHAGGGS